MKRLQSSKMDNVLQLIKQYSAKKSRSKDVRTDALGYMIRERSVLNTELTFDDLANDRKFGEMLVSSPSRTSESP